jgi:putative ABC transport system substrate-binding protein
MNRRSFVLAMGAAMFAARTGAASDNANSRWRIGVLSNSPIDPAKRDWSAFLRALGEEGFGDAQPVLFEPRVAQGRLELLGRLAEELVRARCDVIVVTAGDAAIRAVREATATIPIVMVPSGNPVRDGFVQSLARPGGNATGVADITRDLVPKRLDLLVAAVPRARRVALVSASGFGAGDAAMERHWVQELDKAASALRVELVRFAMRKPGDFEQTAAAVVDSRADAMMLSPSPLNFLLRNELAQFAISMKLATIAARREEAIAGAMMSYGADAAAMFATAAKYVGKILAGKRPETLPVEMAAPEYVINLRTAQRIGIAVPKTLVLLANELIE